MSPPEAMRIVDRPRVERGRGGRAHVSPRVSTPGSPVGSVLQVPKAEGGR
jgi:hypothetical protein